METPMSSQRHDQSIQFFVIETPVLTDETRTIRYMNRCIKDTFERGETAFSIRKLYVDVLTINRQMDSDVFQEMMMTWVERCSGMVIYTDYSITREMRQSMRMAQSFGKSITRRTLLKTYS